MNELITNCERLISAYKNGEIGQTKMPEDSHPEFKTEEEKLVYFTLPMALNYQRNSYKLWESALETFNDKETKQVFDLEKVCEMKEEELRAKLIKYKLALQQNKQTNTWHTISRTLCKDFCGIKEIFKKTNNDFLELKKEIQIKQKKGFPYLSGPKIFNYWSFIIQKYGGIKFKNSEFIDIAPDTHITQASVKLGVISEIEAEKLSKEKINIRWRELLKNTNINPIDMHSPLWFWSKNNFQYKLD